MKTTEKLVLAGAFAATIFGTALVTAALQGSRAAHAQAADKPAQPVAQPPPPPPQPVAQVDTYQISAYIDGDAKNKTLTNGFVVINTKTGKVSNCVANWMGQKDAKCYDWSTWVKLP